MEMRNYEIRGYYYEDDVKIDFVCFVENCFSAYAARNYTLGKLRNVEDVKITNIVRVIE